MPKTFVVSWSMNGTFEVMADSREEVEAMLKTMNRQELVFKARLFDYEIEEIDRSDTGSER